MKSILCLTLMLVGCAKSNSPKYIDAETVTPEGIALIETVRSEDLLSCKSGSGAIIRYGIDNNFNNVLDNGEVVSTSYVCDGSVEQIVVDDGSGDDKIKICHKSGKKNKTLELPQSEVQGHLNHGDTMGECK